jgi:hypothetical protein
MVKTVIGLFENYAEAQKVVQDLVDQGIRRDDIRIIPHEGTAPILTATPSVGDRTPGVDTVAEAAEEAQAVDATVPYGSVTVALIEMGMPEMKALYYSEAVRRGGTLVCVTVDDDKVNQVTKIIDAHGSMDINNQAAQWRRNGWAGVPGIDEEDLLTVQTCYVCDMPKERRFAS